MSYEPVGWMTIGRNGLVTFMQNPPRRGDAHGWFPVFRHIMPEKELAELQQAVDNGLAEAKYLYELLGEKDAECDAKLAQATAAMHEAEKQNQGLKSTNAKLIMRASAAEEAEQAAKEEVARLMSNMYDRATQERAQIEAYERGRSEGHDAGTHDALDSLASEYRRRLQHIVVPF